MIPDELRRDMIRAIVVSAITWYEISFSGERIRHKSDKDDVIDINPEQAAPLLAQGLIRVAAPAPPPVES